MAIEYTEEKRFTVEQVEALFKSVVGNRRSGRNGCSRHCSIRIR